MGIVVAIWFLNFVISIFNAWGCGRSWNETKAEGGFVHFMNWMGAIMSASGFTWCYTILAAFVAANWNVQQENGTSAPALDAESFQALLEMGYVIVIIPILGSGLAITLESWSYFWRRRTFGSGALAGYNSFAQMHNIYSAARTLPGVTQHLGAFFGGSSGKKDARLLVFLLALAALFAGVLTTYTIISMTSESVRSDRALRYGPYR